MKTFDWTSIRRRLRPGEWYLLGQDLPYTTASAISQGHITAMRGVKVRTRNNRWDEQRKRFCDILLSLEESSAPETDR